jgi:hypothetical protein
MPCQHDLCRVSGNKPCQQAHCDFVYSLTQLSEGIEADTQSSHSAEWALIASMWICR